MNRDQLLDALTAERYDNRWWVTPSESDPDSPIITALRRSALLADDNRTTE